MTKKLTRREAALISYARRRAVAEYEENETIRVLIRGRLTAIASRHATGGVNGTPIAVPCPDGPSRQTKAQNGAIA